MPISSVGKASSSRGITLLEMLVVMALIGLIVALTAPSLTAGLDSVRLRSATDDISSFLNSAVNHCERKQRPVELVISAKENHLSLYADDGLSRNLNMPDGISIELPEEFEGIRRLILMPGDTVPGIGIQVASKRGARRVVHLDPMTGFSQVDPVEQP
jgi:type IV fimbrial biogenesis protein FimT